MKRASGYLAGRWCQVTGSLEGDEPAWYGAAREVFEETGIRPIELYSADFCDQFYDPASNRIEIVPVFVAIVASDAEVTLHNEHSVFKWADFETAIDLVPFAGHRTALEIVERDFVRRDPAVWLRIEAFDTAELA